MTLGGLSREDALAATVSKPGTTRPHKKKKSKQAGVKTIKNDTAQKPSSKTKKKLRTKKVEKQK